MRQVLNEKEQWNSTLKDWVVPNKEEIQFRVLPHSSRRRRLVLCVPHVASSFCQAKFLAMIMDCSVLVLCVSSRRFMGKRFTSEFFLEDCT